MWYKNTIAFSGHWISFVLKKKRIKEKKMNMCQARDLVLGGKETLLPPRREPGDQTKLRKEILSVKSSECAL